MSFISLIALKELIAIISIISIISLKTFFSLSFQDKAYQGCCGGGQ
jgi:hypothetical protein